MNEQEIFIEAVKLNLPLDGKGGLSTLQLNRAKWKTNTRVFVDYCVDRKIFILDEVAQTPYIKKYLGKKNKDAETELREPLEQMAFMILHNWRVNNFYDVLNLYSFKPPHPKKVCKAQNAVKANVS